MQDTDVEVGLLGLGAYVPERVMTNQDWAQYVDTSDEWILERTGIRRRRFAAADQSTVDLAAEAARSALADAGLEAADLDEIIVATDTPEARSPDTAAFLQHRLGAREVPTYDLGASGCAGFVQALDVARSRIRCEPRRILVAGVEVLSKVMDWTELSTCVLFGDAAGAAILGRGPRVARILGIVAGTDGSRSDILGLMVGGVRQPFSEEMARQNLHRKIVMNGREVFKEAVRRMGDAALQVLERCGCRVEDLDLVVPHQANMRIIQGVARSLDLPMDKVFVNVHEYGNTGSASVPLALWEARRDGRIRPGALVLLTAFGAGFHWAAALLRF